jgi:hypothetical protein
VLDGLSKSSHLQLKSQVPARVHTITRFRVVGVLGPVILILIYLTMSLISDIIFLGHELQMALAMVAVMFIDQLMGMIRPITEIYAHHILAKMTLETLKQIE